MSVYQWQPNTQYNAGSVVLFEGARYEIVQPHTSLANWTPPATPALWRRLPEIAGGQGQGGYQPSYSQSGQVSSPPPGQQQGEKRWDEHQHQKVDIPQEVQQKKWYDLDDDTKKKLEIGGGLAAGAALLGAGYYAYNRHQKNEEEKKAHVWEAQNWVTGAQARTQQFYSQGSGAPVSWVLVHGKSFPQGAIRGGEENGQPLFICRASYEGSLQVGLVSPFTEKGAVIGYGHDEIHLETYECLVGNEQAVRWVDAHGRLKLDELKGKPVEGGREANGSPLFIAQARIDHGVYPGKVGEHLNAAFVPLRGTEKEAKEYRVLCYA